MTKPIKAKEMCADCGKIFLGGKNAYLCPQCRKRRVEEGKRKANQLELPSAEQWIPCEERLPSRGVPVLVSGIMEDAPPITISTDAPLYYKEGWINAWMPLPKPYEGRTE